MTLPLIRFIQAGPAAPKVVLLPDAMFFTRAIAIAPGASVADVAAQVELSLEALSPFPPAQLYHGHYWTAGAESALVFAAYRRRFSTEQTAEWDNAELVMPAFASLLGGGAKPETTLIVPSAEGLTAIYWEQGPVPAKVAFQPVAVNAPEADVTRAREQLLRVAPSHRSIVLAAGPTVEPSPSDREYAFSAEAYRSRIPLAEAHSLDVRDKASLATLRRAQQRDVVLWRTFLGLVAALLLLGLGELALVGNGLWQKTRRAQAEAQRPIVERIMAAQTLTTRVNELSTNRLLPFEMIALLSEKKPAAVTFTRTSTNGLHGMAVEAYATTPDAVSAYQTALHSVPAIEKVEVRDQRTRDNLMTFTLQVTFRADGVKPAAAPAAP